MASEYTKLHKIVENNLDIKHVNFIQVGAFDGVRADPINPLVVQYGWKGILIEPQPDVMKRLKSNYADHPGLIFEQIAIHETEKEVTLYIEPLQSSRSSILRRNGRLKKWSDKQIKTLHTPAATLDEIVLKHSFGDFDLLQIDVEGYDFNVIKTVSLNKYRPKLIHYEHVHLSKHARAQCEEYLKSHRYVVQPTTLEDTIAIAI